MPWWELDDFIVVHKLGGCAICKQPTRFAELNFQCHLHPGECADRLWKEYAQASAQTP